MNEEQLKNIIEAGLLACEEPLSIDALARLFARKDGFDLPAKDAIRACVKSLQADYENRGVELKEVASGFRFQIKSDYAQWVNRLWEERSPRYSRALLETLAIVAYRQPVTRGEIEGIRGVSVSPGIIRNLLEREWIKVAGYRDVPGRPAVFTTTRLFLDYFNLKNLSELPSLAEIRDINEASNDLFSEHSPAPQVDSVLEPGEPQVPANDEMVEDDTGVTELPDGAAIPVAVVSDGRFDQDPPAEEVVSADGNAEPVANVDGVEQIQNGVSDTVVEFNPAYEMASEPASDPDFESGPEQSSLTADTVSMVEPESESDNAREFPQLTQPTVEPSAIEPRSEPEQNPESGLNDEPERGSEQAPEPELETERRPEREARPEAGPEQENARGFPQLALATGEPTEEESEPVSNVTQLPGTESDPPAEAL